MMESVCMGLSIKNGVPKVYEPLVINNPQV